MFKVGDTVSYNELTGNIINVFSTSAGEVLEILCPPDKYSELDIILWLPVSELLKSSWGLMQDYALYDKADISKMTLILIKFNVISESDQKSDNEIVNLYQAVLNETQYRFSWRILQADFKSEKDELLY